MDFKREFSAGCVVCKREKREIKDANAKLKFLLGKHSGYHKWVLPKGLIEEGERGWQTAIRETEEEMGVKARLLDQKPIHVEKYVYVADLKTQPQISNSQFPISNKKSKVKSQRSKVKPKSERRVAKYQEDGGSKIKVFKTVSFYLAEYESGDPKKHGWEMEDGGWFNDDEALELMAFKGEKEALKKAQAKLRDLKKQPQLFT